MSTVFTPIPHPYAQTIRTNYATNPRLAVSTAGWGYYPGVGGAGAISGPWLSGTPPVAVPWPGKHIGYQQSTSASDGAGPSLAVAGVTPGVTYTASGYVRPTTSRSMRIVVDWYNASSAFISNNLGSSVAATAAQWSRLSAAAIVAPAGAASATMSFRDVAATTAGLAVDVTCVMFENQGGVGTYFDGSTPPAAGAWCKWTGTPGLSTSLQYIQAPVAAAVTSAQDGLMEWDETSTRRITEHWIIGQPDPTVTVASPDAQLDYRRGTFQSWHATEPDARAFVQLLYAGAVMVQDPQRPTIAPYIVVRDAAVAPYGDDKKRWTVRASWSEISPNGLQ